MFKLPAKLQVGLSDVLSLPQAAKITLTSVLLYFETGKKYHFGVTIFFNEHDKGWQDLVKGVANGKCETLRDSETSAFLCEPETF